MGAAWWIETRSRSEDYSLLGAQSSMAVSQWWSVYGQRTDHGVAWFIVEVEANGRWRSYFGMPPSERGDFRGRRIRNSVIAEGERCDAELLRTVLRAYLAPRLPLQAALESMCTETRVAQWQRRRAETSGVGFDQEESESIYSALFGGVERSVVARAEVPAPGLYETGAAAALGGDDLEPGPLGRDDGSTQRDVDSVVAAAFEGGHPARIGYVSFAQDIADAAMKTAPARRPGKGGFEVWLIRGAGPGLRAHLLPSDSPPPNPTEARPSKPAGRAPKPRQANTRRTAGPGWERTVPPFAMVAFLLLIATTVAVGMVLLVLRR